MLIDRGTQGGRTTGAERRPGRRARPQPSSRRRSPATAANAHRGAATRLRRGEIEKRCGARQRLRAGCPAATVQLLGHKTGDRRAAEEIAQHSIGVWARLSAGEGTKGARLHDWAYRELADSTRRVRRRRTGYGRGGADPPRHRRRRAAFFATWCPDGTASRPWSRSKDTAGRSRIVSRRPRTNSASTTTRAAPGTAGIVTSRSSCSLSP